MRRAEHQDDIGPGDVAGLVIVGGTPNSDGARRDDAEKERPDEDEGDDYRMASHESHDLTVPRGRHESADARRGKLSYEDGFASDLLHDPVKLLTGLGDHRGDVHALPLWISEFPGQSWPTGDGRDGDVLRNQAQELLGLGFKLVNLGHAEDGDPLSKRTCGWLSVLRGGWSGAGPRCRGGGGSLAPGRTFSATAPPDGQTESHRPPNDRPVSSQLLTS